MTATTSSGGGVSTESASTRGSTGIGVPAAASEGLSESFSDAALPLRVDASPPFHTASSLSAWPPPPP